MTNLKFQCLRVITVFGIPVRFEDSRIIIIDFCYFPIAANTSGDLRTSFGFQQWCVR